MMKRVHADSALAFETHNDLSEPVRRKVIGLLTQPLADAIDLQSQIKQAHWNVKGPNFIGLHELFDKIAADVTEYVDELAERIIMLGGRVQGTVRVTANRTSLKEYPLTISDGVDHVEAVSAALSAFGQVVRESIDKADDAGDKDTADLCTQISRGIDKWVWFVEAHNQARK